MRKRACLATLLVFSLLLPTLAQQGQRTTTNSTTTQQQLPPPSPQDAPRNTDDDDVVRITTNLVQVDAVVVDKKGRQVTDLRAEDFEILEDNRPQKITNFSYVLNETAPAPASPKPADKFAPPDPPRRLRPEQVRRTMALVVDDLGLSFESLPAVKHAIKKFVNEQMQPNDMVAIVRTSAGVGALQQFTSDKRQLNFAVDRIKWSMIGRGGISVFAPIEGGGMPSAPMPGANNNDPTRRQIDRDAELGDFREEIFAVGTLGGLNYVVRGMRELPGRKSVILFSDGFALYTPDRGRGRDDRVLVALRQLTDLANRASVVVYSIDPRGLVFTGITAADDVSGMSTEQINNMVSARSENLFDTQSGLDYLARQTGGFLIKNNNDVVGGIRRIVEDQKGYYLIGYRPDGATFDRRFHRISAKVNRPGLKVRTRTGFFGVRDEETRPVRRTREQQLLAALTSPFSSPDVHLRLTTIFGNNEQMGSFMRSLAHIDARDLKFTQEPDGRYKTVLDVIGVTFRDTGQVVDSGQYTQTLTMKEDAYRRALRDGLVYSLNVPIKKPGAYQLRMAVRDTLTERTGSASQFIEVPDLKKNRLTLSGLIMTGAEQTDAAKPAGHSPAAEMNGQPSQGAADERSPLTDPAVRRFRQNAKADFAYVIYNAQLDKATNLPRLTTQTRIFRDGNPVFVGKEMPFDMEGQTDLKRLSAAMRLTLGSNFTPGEYVLQVVVTDALAKEKYRTTTQWTDFEIVR